MQLIWKMLSKEKGATASSKEQYRKWIFIQDRDCFQFLQEQLHLFFVHLSCVRYKQKRASLGRRGKSLSYLFHRLKLTLNVAFAQVIYLWGVKLKMLFFSYHNIFSISCVSNLILKVCDSDPLKARNLHFAVQLSGNLESWKRPLQSYPAQFLAWCRN